MYHNWSRKVYFYKGLWRMAVSEIPCTRTMKTCIRKRSFGGLFAIPPALAWMGLTANRINVSQPEQEELPTTSPEGCAANSSNHSRGVGIQFVAGCVNVGLARIFWIRLTPRFKMLYGEGIPSVEWGHISRRELQVIYGVRFSFG